jgi:hypothetical protein
MGGIRNMKLKLQILKGSVTQQEYINFQRFLRENLDVLEEKIEEKGVLSKKKLKEIISEYCAKQKVSISNAQIDIFLQVMDSNGMLKFYQKAYKNLRKWKN